MNSQKGQDKPKTNKKNGKLKGQDSTSIYKIGENIVSAASSLLESEI